MEKTIEAILKERIIVIVRGVEKDKIIPFAEAVYRGGIRILECTFDASKKVSDIEIAEKIKLLSKHFGNRMIIGAGTVLTEEQVVLTKEAGGKFIISPDTNQNVIKKTKEQNLVSIPGAFTASEVVMANRAGADFVKLFPIGALGSSYIKDISAPLSNVRFLAVGGVDTDNMSEYIKNGACGIGVGSSIVNKKFISEEKYDEIERLAKKYTNIITAL